MLRIKNRITNPPNRNMMNVKFNKLKVAKYFFYLMLLFCASCSEPKPPQVTFDVPVFDIPALFGKNIDEVKKILGKPTESDPDPPKHKEKGNYSCFYDKDEQTLWISYDPYTRIIKSFHIISSIKYDNIKDLLKLGNIHSLEGADYQIEIEHPIFTRDFRSFSVILK